MKKALEARDVKFLFHFTREVNIDSILKYGLLPKNKQNSLPTQAVTNDSLRLDFRENTSSLSISFPNYKLFYRFRKENESQGVEWGVIVFKKTILLDKECLFCSTNTANSFVSMQDDSSLKGVDAFQSLYREISGKPSRKELDIPDNYPTDPQAEVLVKGIIEPQYIRAVVFNNSTFESAYKAKYPNMDVRNLPGYFNARKDYEHWK